MAAVDAFEYVAGDERLTAMPTSRPGLDAYLSDARKSFWVAEEIVLDQDVVDYKTKMTPGMRHLVDTVMAFFAASDGIINVNLAERFAREVRMQDATYFYNFQTAMEDIHAKMYSLLINTIVSDPDKRDSLLNAVKTIPVITKISDYMHRVIGSDAPFAERLLAMACVEGILFQGCFCVIYWLQQQGLMPGLGQSNELIARDEALHTMFALFLYMMMKPEYHLPRDRAAAIIDEVVELADELNRYALPEGLLGMNADLMLDHVKSCADGIFDLITPDIGPAKPLIYNIKSAFSFMDQLNMTNRNNFFERKETNYAKANSQSGADEIADDF